MTKMNPSVCAGTLESFKHGDIGSRGNETDAVAAKIHF
jgi:hypothetical protein